MGLSRVASVIAAAAVVTATAHQLVSAARHDRAAGSDAVELAE